MIAPPTAPPLPSFGVILQQYRKRAGMSLGQLATAAEIDKAYVYRLETKAKNPSAETAMALADGLGLNQVERAALIRIAGFWPPDPVGALRVSLAEVIAEAGLAAEQHWAILQALTSLEGVR